MESFWINVGIVAAVIWIIGFIPAYKKIKKWGKSTFETIWYTIFWPVLILLYLIHKVHNS